MSRIQLSPNKTSLKSTDTLQQFPSHEDISRLTFEREEEYEKFAQYCGITKGERLYGKFEISGVVTNLKYNRFLKKSGTDNNRPNKTVSEILSSTQEAFWVNIDQEAFARPRDLAVISALPEKKHTLFRVKDIKYGNHNAMWEILAGQMYGLSGMTAPDSRFLVHDDFVDGSNGNGAPKTFVASPKITGYSDIGDFLIDNNIEEFIDPESLGIWRKQKKKIEVINEKSKSDLPVTDQDKRDRVKAMGKIYDLLPDYFHTEIEKAFAASKFVANWDFANFSLNNIGCRFTFDKFTSDGGRKVIGFESVFVDFGNSGANGFGGKYKELSLDLANSEAKTVTAKPKDYDPSLTFTAEENALIESRWLELGEEKQEKILEKARQNFLRKNPEFATIPNTLARSASSISGEGWALIDHPSVGSPIIPTQEEWNEKITKTEEYFKRTAAINSLAKDLSDEEERNGKAFFNRDEEPDIRRSIIFKSIHHILPHEAGMVINPKTSGLLTFSDLPRNLPIGILLKPALNAKTKAALHYLNKGDQSHELYRESSFYRDSEVEMAYRFSLISDEAIEHVAKKWYLCEEFPNIFPLPEQFKHDPKYKTAEGVATLFKERRDALIKTVPPEIIEEWKVTNRAQTLAAEQEVKLAILKKTTVLNPDFDINSDSTSSDLSGKSIDHPKIKSAQELKELILNFEQSFIEVHQRNRDISELENYLPLTNNANIRLVLEQQIKKIAEELEQSKTTAVLDFISNNMEKWKADLGLDHKPNCSLFNLNKMKEVEHIKFNVDDTVKLKDDQIITAEQNSERNSKIHQANCAALAQFINILDELSLVQTKDLVASNNTDVTRIRPPSTSAFAPSLLVRSKSYTIQTNH